MSSSATTPELSLMPDDVAPAKGRRLGKLAWVAAFAGVILAGAVLRLVACADMEYKADEIWTFVQTQPDPNRPFPRLGMPSSAGMDNPGMSVWVFMGLGRLFGADNPVSLARIVQVLSIAAIGLQIIFALRWAPPAEREAWLWSAALLSVNPLAVLFHRKIWPPSVLPIFISLMLIAWWHRRRPFSAFAWGLIGALIGQIHMGGFHFAAAAALWTWWLDRKGTAWLSWALGSALGALPMIPWIQYLLDSHGNRAAAPLKWQHIFEAKYWLRWFSEPFGWGLDYSLGDDFRDFLAQPIVAGRSTWLVAGLHAAAISLGIWLLIRWGRQKFGLGGNSTGSRETSSTHLAQTIGMWGYGLLLTLSLVPIHRHYMIIIYPLEFLWMARIAVGAGSQAAGEARSGRALLAGMCILQMLISASFLGYVHAKQVIRGEYGVVYQAQAERAALRR
jgi:hypothetical protein